MNCTTCGKPIKGKPATYKEQPYDKKCFDTLLWKLPMEEVEKIAKGTAK